MTDETTFNQLLAAWRDAVANEKRAYARLVAEAERLWDAPAGRAMLESLITAQTVDDVMAALRTTEVNEFLMSDQPDDPDDED